MCIKLKGESTLIDFFKITVRCFIILLIFGYFLPKIIDELLFISHKSNFYYNSIFVNYVVDKNSKIFYNYMYIIKLILNL